MSNVMPRACDPSTWEAMAGKIACQGYEASLDYQSEPLSQILKYNNSKALLTFKRLTVRL